MSSSSLPSRRLITAVGVVGAPVCLLVGGLLLPSSAGSPAQQVETVQQHVALYTAGSVLDAAGFALLGALGVGIAMLLPRRGSVLGTLAAVVTLIGGFVMGAAVLVTGLIEASIPVDRAAAILPTLEASPALGILFQGALLAAVGGVLGAIGLMIGRPVRLWVPMVLVVGILLSTVSGGPLGAVLGLPFLVAAVLLARALVRPATLPAAAARARETVGA